METTIKDQVKNIFKTNAFETALDLTRNLRGEYIHEYGVKSWNALVTYYKNANIQPVAEVAEQEAEYNAESESTNETDEVAEIESEEAPATTEEATEETSSTDKEVGEEKPQESSEVSESEDEETQEVDTFEYMLYRNTGDKVEWFGHRENFYGLKVGDTARMIRMNNMGVSEGMVVATAALTLDHINLFHRCYGVIIKTKYSYKEQLNMAATCLNNMMAAVKDFSSLPKSDIKLTDYVINFEK